MVRKIPTTKTAEERRAEAEALHNAIAEQVEALRDSTTWRHFLDFTQAFHHYSLNNLLLIMSQRPDATHVAGYRTWQKLGRQVRRGERGIRIYGGREVTVSVADEVTGEETERKAHRFFPVSVFDISQTDPTDADQANPGELAQRLTGGDPNDIYGAVVDYLNAQGWSVELEHIAGAANGYTTTDGSRRVVVADDLSPAQAAKTALHEAAHVLLHTEEDRTEYVAHRGIKETEAESVAYVVAGPLGLDTSAYSVGYVAGWSACDSDTIKATAARVLAAAHRLVLAITEPAASAS